MSLVVSALLALGAGCGVEPEQGGGDTGRVDVELGSTVTLVVIGATADEVHVQGYHVYLTVPARGSARLAVS